MIGSHWSSLATGAAGRTRFFTVHEGHRHTGSSRGPPIARPFFLMMVPKKLDPLFSRLATCYQIFEPWMRNKPAQGHDVLRAHHTAWIIEVTDSTFWSCFAVFGPYVIFGVDIIWELATHKCENLRRWSKTSVLIRRSALIRLIFGLLFTGYR